MKLDCVCKVNEHPFKAHVCLGAFNIMITKTYSTNPHIYGVRRTKLQCNFGNILKPTARPTKQLCTDSKSPVVVFISLGY